ncbi:MAG TPA: HAMP domain-containing sensor histidine kinase, partial [Candidatus Dormibacteraeota bacterium]|nr:HAMP domain-containing sensor histidine kinase [Candidatus Dormibacteraeota bacterium]
MATSERPIVGSAGEGDGADRDPTQLEQLRFLHHVARLATKAQTWDELLETVVDQTRDALHADVSSLYLLDRDERNLTLAATNGLDKYQIGRATVPFGEGVTGRVAAARRPTVISDVRHDPRFLWVRGIDQKRFVASMLSVPLVWHDRVVGVLNVQTERPRRFDDGDVAQLGAIADLLAGIVERVRLQQEAEARADELRAIDQARTELIALVTHELRTPLAVVRAYTDLLSEEPTLDGRESRDPVRRAQRDGWHSAAIGQIERLDRLIDSVLASVRSTEEAPAQVVPVDIGRAVTDVLDSMAPLLSGHRVEPRIPVERHALADPPRLRQIVEHLLENAVKYAPPATRIGVEVGLVEGVVRISVSDEGPGIPPDWRERVFEPYARRDTRTARGSGIGLYAARRLAESMGGRVWYEPVAPTGARFVLALPAAV